MGQLQYPMAPVKRNHPKTWLRSGKCLNNWLENLPSCQRMRSLRTPATPKLQLFLLKSPSKVGNPVEPGEAFSPLSVVFDDTIN